MSFKVSLTETARQLANDLNATPIKSVAIQAQAVFDQIGDFDHFFQATNVCVTLLDRQDLFDGDQSLQAIRTGGAGAQENSF